MPTTGSERAEIHSVGQRPTEQEQSRAQALKARNPIPVKHRIPPFRGAAGGAIPFNRALPYPGDFALSEQLGDEDTKIDSHNQ